MQEFLTAQNMLLALLTVVFGAWARNVKTGVAAVDKSLGTGLSSISELVRSNQIRTDERLLMIEKQLTELATQMKGFQDWQEQHIRRPHLEAVERLQEHEDRLKTLEDRVA